MELRGAAPLLENTNVRSPTNVNLRRNQNALQLTVKLTLMSLIDKPLKMCRIELICPENSDAAHNVLHEAFSLCADSAEITNALILFMNSGSLDSAQALRAKMQEAVDEMTRSEIEKFLREVP